MIKAVIFDLWQTVVYSDWGFGSKVIKTLDLSVKKEEELWILLEEDWMKHRFETIKESAKHAYIPSYTRKTENTPSPTKT